MASSASSMQPRYTFRHLYPKGRQGILATMVALGLVVMALLSASSTAYAGLAVLALVYMANWLRRAVSSSPLDQSGLVSELLVGLGLMVALVFVLLARADLLDPLLNLINELIFNKHLTYSFYERSQWNSIAWNAVSSTWGLGVGIGSTRTSNWFAAIISNAGVIGATFMGIFLVQTFARRLIWRAPLFLELLPALKLSLLPALTMAGVAAAGPDFGPWIATLFGAITGIALLRFDPSPVGRVAEDKPISAWRGGRGAIGRRAFGRSMASAPRQVRGPGKPAPRPSL